MSERCTMALYDLLAAQPKCWDPDCGKPATYRHEYNDDMWCDAHRQGPLYEITPMRTRDVVLEAEAALRAAGFPQPWKSPSG